MKISTIVLAVTGGGGGTAPDKPIDPKDPGFVKKTLEKIAKGLAWLVDKAAAALPGIIGSIISWLINFLSKAVGFVAENTWALFIAVAGVILCC